MDPLDTNIITSAPQTVKIVDDHEVSMAAAQVYRAAKCAMEIHRMLKMVDNLEGWMQAKITLAADYLEAVSSNLEYDLVAATMMESQTLNENPDHKHARIAALGRQIMDLAQGMTGKSDADFDLMNRFSAVGEKMTMIGTPFGPKGLTAEEKDLVRQAQEMIRSRRGDVEEGIGDAWRGVKDFGKGLAKGAKEFWHGSPEERSSEHAELMHRWLQALSQVGITGTQAQQMAQKMIAQGFEPNRTDLREARSHLPGVPGKIIARAGEYLLIHDVQKQDDVKKNEYEVYTKGGERVTNLDMPYSTPSAAEKRFKREYGSR